MGTSKLIGVMQKVVSRSRMATWLATKAANQCNAIIHSRLNDGRDPDRNGEYRLLDLAGPDVRVFFDIGANVGYWAERLGRVMKHPSLGVLIEPAPDAIARLRTAAASFGFPVEIVEAAAGEVAGEMAFFAEPDAGETSSLVRDFSISEAHEIRVRITTVDHEISTRGIGFVDLLKIDAEGFDLKVLLGARDALRAQRIGIVQFEYNRPWASVGATLSQAIALLSDCGYEVFLLKEAGLFRPMYGVHGEYFGYSNYVAVLRDQAARLAPMIREEALF
jgi:FkbM family methyltransferase